MKHETRKPRWALSPVAAALLCAIAAIAVTAGSVAAAPPIPTPPAKFKSELNLIPAKLRPYYSGWWYFSKIQKNPYAEMKAVKGPWQWCYASSYEGNTWRQSATAEVKSFVAKQAKAGLAKSSLTFTNSNGDVNLTVSQINDMVRKGCSVILTVAPSPTGLCAAADNAFKHGIMVVSVESPTQCKNMVNIGLNEYYTGLITADWLGKTLKTGNVLLTNGIPGYSVTVARRTAAIATLKQYPGVKVVGEITGNWTGTIAKSATLKWIATHPGTKVDGIWDGGAMGVAAAQAFQQSGKSLPKVAGFAGECQLLAFWKQNHLNSFSTSQGGGTAFNEAMALVTRMLKGQQPKINTILYPLPLITQQNFNKWYKPSMTLNSTCFSEPAGLRAVPNSYYAPLFG